MSDSCAWDYRARMAAAEQRISNNNHRADHMRRWYQKQVEKLP